MSHIDPRLRARQAVLTAERTRILPGGSASACSCTDLGFVDEDCRFLPGVMGAQPLGDQSLKQRAVSRDREFDPDGRNPLDLPPWLQVNDFEMIHAIRQIQQRRAVLGVVLGPLRIAPGIPRNRVHRLPERNEHEFHAVSERTPKKHPSAIAVHVAVVRMRRIGQKLRVFVGFCRAGPASPHSDDHRSSSVRVAWLAAGSLAKRESG